MKELSIKEQTVSSLCFTYRLQYRGFKKVIWLRPYKAWLQQRSMLDTTRLICKI